MLAVGHACRGNDGGGRKCEAKGVLHSPAKTSSLLLLLKADVLQFEGAGDEADVTALLHQTAYPPVIVVFLQRETNDILNVSDFQMNYLN